MNSIANLMRDNDGSHVLQISKLDDFVVNRRGNDWIEPRSRDFRDCYAMCHD